MITPKFTVTQDSNHVTIVIKAPHIKTQNVDINVQGDVFKFNLKPYFLRLTFPGNVLEDERSKATYDVGSGELTVILAKETPGEHFPDLDMLTRLLVRKGDITDNKQIKRPLIEVLSSGETLEGTRQVDKDENFDWEMPQEIRQEVFSEVRYGFNNRYSGFFTHVQETANDVLDVYDPEHATLETRREDRIKRENDKFDDEYYMSDFMIEEEIQHLLKYKTQWWNELRTIQKAEKENAGKKPKEMLPLIPATVDKTVPTVSASPGSHSTTFSSAFAKPVKPATPSIFNIVNKEDSDDESPSTIGGLGSGFGMKEVSTKSILKDVTPSTSNTPSLVLDVTSNATTTTPTADNLESMMMATEAPLIDESEPIRHLGGENIVVVDSTRTTETSTSVGGALEDELADMSITGEAVLGAKPFSSKEQELMRDLPKREYILENAKSTYLGLIDILFAYSYDLRVGEGDTTVETAWTICKLSSSMAALDQFTTLKETLVASVRRSLAYPLSRNWNLAMKVLQDVYVIFKLGRRGILRALLQIKDILDHDDVYYIYSKMFLEDYCVWIQSASENVVRTLAHELHHFKLEKSDLGWHLEELETLAKEAPEMEEEAEEEEEESSDDDSDEDTSSDEDDSSDEEESDEDESEDEIEDKDKEEKVSEPPMGEDDTIFMHEGPRPKIIELN